MKQSRKKSIAFKPSRSRKNVVPPPDSPSQNPSSSDASVEKVSDPVLKPVILAITNDPKSTARYATNKNVPEPETAAVLTETSIQAASGKRKSVANKKVPEPEIAEVSIQSAPDKRKSVANKKVPELETAKVSVQSGPDKRKSVANKKDSELETAKVSIQSAPDKRKSVAHKKVHELETAKVSVQSAPDKRKSVANKKDSELETAKVSIQSAPVQRKSVANKKVPELETEALAEPPIQSSPGKRKSVANKKVSEAEMEALPESSTQKAPCNRTSEANKKVPEPEAEVWTETPIQTTPGKQISEANKKVTEPEPEPEPEPVTESGNAVEMVSNPEKSGAKRGATQKIWTLGDEVLVLHALADFRKETGTDPETYLYDFYRYVIAKLSNGEFTKSQVIDKVRRMKKKFKNNVVKSTNEFSNLRELELFKLSKKFWGDLNPNADGGNKRNHANAGTSQSSKRVKVSPDNVVDDGDTMDVDMEEKGKDFKSGFNERYRALTRAIEGKSVPRVTLFDGLKTSLRLVDPSKLQDWDSKYKELHLAEYDVYLRKLSLIHELSSWHYNSMKSSMC